MINKGGIVMRKIWSVLLVMVFFLICVPSGVVSAESVVASGVADTLTWSLDDTGHLVISGNGPMPEWYEGPPWQEYITMITTVTIEEGITSIGMNSFYNCNALKKVHIANSVTFIGGFAFAGCDSLKTVTIPDGVKQVANFAFIGCKGLTSVIIGDGLEYLANDMFVECVNLSTVTMGNGIEVIYQGVFRGCDKLVSLTIPESVEYIEPYAFWETSITSVTFLGPVEEMDYAFEDAPVNEVYYTGAKEEWPEFADYFKGATCYYECINPKDSYASNIQHSVMDTESGYGLAFRFKLNANGVKVKNGTEVDLTAATINYLGTDCKLIGMGAVVTNNETAAKNLTLETVNDYNVVNVPTVYLQETDEEFCAFATRIINIPGEQLERTIYARPYYTIEVDGEQITVYGDVDSATCAEYL